MANDEKREQRGIRLTDSVWERVEKEAAARSSEGPKTSASGLSEWLIIDGLAKCEAARVASTESDK